jgi:carboxylate-amine ligase
MSLTVEETMCIVSVIQAVVAKLYKLNLNNMSFNIYRLALIKKINFGLQAWNHMIDFGLQRSGNKMLILELLDCDDVVDEVRK